MDFVSVLCGDLEEGRKAELCCASLCSLVIQNQVKVYYKTTSSFVIMFCQARLQICHLRWCNSLSQQEEMKKLEPVKTCTGIVHSLRKKTGRN